MSYRSSVIIPVFNTGKILIETIESTVKQAKGKDEIIIIDDASTDEETINVLNEIKQNEYIRIIRHDRNRGLGAARNTGIKNASADIIVPLDSDDLLAPGYFEKMLEPFSDPEVSFTYCDVQYFGESDELRVAKPFKTEQIIESQYICGCSPFRKSVHEAVGGYCEEEIFRYMNEDWDFWLSVCEKGYKGVYIPGGMYLYRRRKMNMTMKPRIFSLDVQKRLLERHWNFIVSYMPPQKFLAHGFKEVGYAYLQLNKPLDSLHYIKELLKISGKRMVGLILLFFVLKRMFRI